MQITAKQFQHNTSVVSKKQFEDHTTLYEGYIKMANLTDETLSKDAKPNTANASGGHYRGWKKTETYSINGIILHELYFQNLESCGMSHGQGVSAPVLSSLGAKTSELINGHFGSFEKWREDFTACATSARGWCILAYEQRTATCRNILLDTHDEGNITTAFPIIVLDMYEHAYFLDYGTGKDSYINRFINNLPWRLIEERAAIVA